MRRRLFNFAAALSLVLFVGLMVFWFRSYFRGNWARYETSTHHFDAISEDGQLLVGGRRGGWISDAIGRREWAIRFLKTPQYSELKRFPGTLQMVKDALEEPEKFKAWEAGPSDPKSDPLIPRRRDRPSLWSLLGFWTMRMYGHLDVAWSGYWVVIPDWLPAVISAVLPIAWLIARHRRRKRHLTGLCATCGYSLTGNTSGVCPECGTPVPKELAPNPMTEPSGKTNALPASHSAEEPIR